MRFIGEDGSYFYALELESEGRPIWDMQREMGLSIAFLSLEAMLKTLNTWLRDGVLVFTGGEWGFTSEARAARIAVDLNPGVESQEEQLSYWAY